MIKTAYPLQLRFAPGEKWEYCNVGYFALAEIIRKVTGKPWSSFLSERVFAPLEMNATRPTSATDVIQNRADGYAWEDNKLQNDGFLLALRPSGAFLSTVFDLAKWDAALYTNKILKQSFQEQMWTPVKLNDGAEYSYGFGWELSKVGSHKLVHHGGSLGGFRSEFARFIDDKLTIIILANGNNAKPYLIALGVAAFYIPNLTPEQRAVAAVEANPKPFDGYAK